MNSITPVIPGCESDEMTYAADQPEYNPLTVLRTERGVMSRWRLTDVERAWIADGNDLFIVQLNFDHALQPICPFMGTDKQAFQTLIELTTED